MIDIAKKLILKYDIQTLDDILYYFLRCYFIKEGVSGSYEVRKNEKYIYEYYDLEKIDEEWLNACNEQSLLF